METSQVFINGWMNRQNVIYTHNEILLGLKKEWNSNVSYNMDEPWKYCLKWIKNRHKMTSIVWFHLHKISRIGEIVEAVSRLEIARGFLVARKGGWRNGCLCGLGKWPWRSCRESWGAIVMRNSLSAKVLEAWSPNFHTWLK